MFVYLLFFLIFLCVLHLILNYNEKARMIKKIPGPKMDFIIGNARILMKSSVEMMQMGREFARKWNGIYSFWIFPYSNVVIFNPEDIEIIMSSMKYTDKNMPYKLLKPWLGNGLLNNNGTQWQERRKILTPSFHFNILKQFCDIIDENCDQFVDNLKNTAGEHIDIGPVLSELTLNTICETAMGTKLNEDNTAAAKSYKQALHNLSYLIYHRIIRVYLYPDFLFNLTTWGRQQIKHLKTIHNFTELVIEQRKDYIKRNAINFNAIIDDDDTYVYKKKTAMLDLLIAAENEGLIDKTGVKEEVDTFMFEGHDTTATGLTFCLMLIANHKEIQDKIREELIEMYGESKRAITMEDLNKMKYLDRCIKESLRMFPPVHYVCRELHETVVLSNYTIPVGTHCHIRIIDLHNREDIFKNPNKFDPDRFLPENCLKRHPYAYIPFSAGPRNCIGQKFAMIEMKIVVAKVLQEFELAPVTRLQDICLMADVVLRHNGPMLVSFIKRKL